MPTLTIFLLGPPRIECDGKQLTVDTRKAIALLAHLAATRQQHMRDTLAGLLWPDYDQSHARDAAPHALDAAQGARRRMAGRRTRDDQARARRGPTGGSGRVC